VVQRPLVSSTLRADSIDLVNTVIHEITHATYYAAGGATFNESFANFVGARGSAEFFRSRGSIGAAQEAEARWSDDKLMASFWARLYNTVDSAFKGIPMTGMPASPFAIPSTGRRESFSSTSLARSFASSGRARWNGCGSTTARCSRIASISPTSISSIACG
jgi:predicted aminopeptidase